jgi:hypothetical protein
VEAFGAYVVHGKESEGLREWYSIGSGLQEFDVRIHASENCSQSHLAGTSFWEWAFGEEDRTPGSGKALDGPKKFLAIDGKDRSFLIGNADPGWPRVLDDFGSLSRHYIKRITRHSQSVNVT